jgi:chemotaxis signal transduction protein
MIASRSASDQFVLCDVGPFTLALPPAAVAGVGTADTDADVGLRLDLATELGAEGDVRRTHMVQVRANGAAVGLIVGAVRGARDLPAGCRFALPAGAGSAVGRAFTGLLVVEDRVVPVLDVAGLFGAPEATADWPAARWDDLPAVRTDSGKVLAFPAGDEAGPKPVLYGLTMSSVVELAPAPEVQPIPLAESPVRGWVAWRGRPLVVRDLTPEAMDVGPRPRLAVLRSAVSGEPYGVVLPGSMQLRSVGEPHRACVAPSGRLPVALRGWVEFRDAVVGLLPGA